MKSETESFDEQGNYQWPWCQTGTFVIDFVKTDGERSSVEGDLSRAFIKDSELLKASKRPKEEKLVAEEEFQEEFDEMSLKDQLETTSSNLQDAAKTDFAYDVLPKWSCEFRKKQKKRQNRNYRSFPEFWEVSSYWLVHLTWLHDFRDQMTLQNQEELEKQCEAAKPIHLIDEHENLLENPNYTNVTKAFIEANVDVTFEEIYTEHCNLIKKRSETDYHLFQTRSITRRCKDMMSRVKRLGYAPGFEDSQFPLFYNLDQSNTKREKPVIEELRYNIDDSYAKKYCGSDIREEKSEQPETPDSNTEEKQIVQKTTDLNEIRFNFDPETEQHLIASNAEKLYANDPEICKYYYQRYRLFSRLDEGVIMDREGWFSVTPEAIAEHIADRVVRHGVSVVIDAFTGVGGNAIQFALRGAHVIAIDMDPVRLKCARQNAMVYGVEDYIQFICADFFDVAATWLADKKSAPRVDAVFLSPPWGGPSYLNAKEFDLETGCTPNGIHIFDTSLEISPNIAYFLPRNTKVSQLTELAMKAKTRVEIEQSSLNSKIKTITAYYGKLAFRESRAN